MGEGSQAFHIIYMVQEELALWSHIKGIAKGSCFADHFFQNIPGIPLIAGAVRTIHITDQTGYFPLLGSSMEMLRMYRNPDTDTYHSLPREQILLRKNHQTSLYYPVLFQMTAEIATFFILPTDL